MKQALLAVAAIALVIWVISWFRADDAVAVSASRAWPDGMGTLESVAGRFPRLQENEAARKLASLAATLPRDEATDEFVRRETAAGKLAIGQPPALSDVTAIRELLLHEPVVWQHHVSFDHPEAQTRRALQMTMARALTATALAKGRDGDQAAWEELHAVWNLARSLDGHPQMMARTASLTMARMINAVAWKLPLPTPPWLDELQTHDHVRPLLEAFQYQTASYWESGAQLFPTKMLANSVDHDRAIAEALTHVIRCDPTTRMNELGPDLRSVWSRAFRYRAEREATANALRVREGKPIETGSSCSEGKWSLEGTTLRFSYGIPLNTSERPMPLELQVQP